MKVSDLEFDKGVLVKIKGMRPEYADGYTAIENTKQLAELVLILNHQLAEVTGTFKEWKDMPCDSLWWRAQTAIERAIIKLKELK